MPGQHNRRALRTMVMKILIPVSTILSLLAAPGVFGLEPLWVKDTGG